MVTNLTRQKLPPVGWRKIKNKILGAKYDLSLVFAGDKETAKITKKYRAKNKPANVLAFALDKWAGEVFVDLPLVFREADGAGKTRRAYLVFLYIHALLHLKGFKHDTNKELKIMNKAEQKWLKALS